MKPLISSILNIAIILLVVAGCTPKSADSHDVKFYAMDCGTIDVSDMSTFSREGRFDGQNYSLVVPCFLIRHPKGDLLWDVGMDQALADMPNGIGAGTASHSTVKTKLTDQLAQLALKPADIDYLSLSHSHPDHAGNANLFAGSIFIANKPEHTFMFSKERRLDHESFRVFSNLENAETILFEDEYDVFGDDRVVIKSMPGHTPGSAVLLVKLTNAGAILLTGDLYTHADARKWRTIPVFNTDAVATRQSYERFEELAKTQNARVIIEHERADFEALPKFPLFLD